MLFDYWRTPQQTPITSFLKNTLSQLNQLYIFVSHFHKDHYNPEIFELNRLPALKCHYFLSPDTARLAAPYFRPKSLYKGPRKVPPDIVHILAEKQHYQDANIHITTFGSTDAGVSYLVELNKKTYYHAGDNNAWIWREDEASDNEMLARYQTILSDIKTFMGEKTPDVAMLPVDPRLGPDSHLGMELFLKQVGSHQVHQMHFHNQ